jgi:hypothetical protein
MDEPGEEHARLAGTRWPDERNEPTPTFEPCEQLGHQGLASEELCGIRLLERTQTLVRVLPWLRRLVIFQLRIVEQDRLLDSLQPR